MVLLTVPNREPLRHRVFALHSPNGAFSSSVAAWSAGLCAAGIDRARGTSSSYKRTHRVNFPSQRESLSFRDWRETDLGKQKSVASSKKGKKSNSRTRRKLSPRMIIIRNSFRGAFHCKAFFQSENYLHALPSAVSELTMRLGCGIFRLPPRFAATG